MSAILRQKNGPSCSTSAVVMASMSILIRRFFSSFRSLWKRSPWFEPVELFPSCRDVILQRESNRERLVERYLISTHRNLLLRALQKCRDCNRILDIVMAKALQKFWDCNKIVEIE